jgi:multiple RNA-binding domain-containing protein 1
VEFTEPADAKAALESVDGSIFQGRLVHVITAAPKRTQKLDDYEISKLPLKKQKLLKKKAEAGKSTFNWNSLYMNVSSA